MGAPRKAEFVGGATAAVGILAAAFHAGGVGGFSVQVQVYRAVLPLLTGAVAALYWHAGSAGATGPAARRTLRLIAAGFTVLCGFEVARWWITVTGRPDAYPVDFPAGDVGNLVAVLCGLAAALSIPTRRGNHRHRVRLTVDMVTVLVAALTGYWYYASASAVADGGQRSLVLRLLPVVILLVALAAVARVLLAGAVGMRPSTLLLGAAGCAVEAAAGLLIPVLLGTPYQHLLLVTSPALIALFAAGAVLHIRFATHPDRARPRDVPPPPKPYSMLPYLSVAGIFALLILVWARGEQARGWPVVVGAVVVTVLVTTRQILAFRDNAHLTRELDATLDTLRHAARNDDILLTAANALMSAPDAGAVFDEATRAAAALLDDPGGRVSVVATGPDPDGRVPVVATGPDGGDGRLDLPLAGSEPGGATGVLRITSAGPVPAETLRALSALQQQVDLALTTVALRRQLTHRALHDPLTGLANRTQLHHRLEQLAADPDGRSVVVLLIDLDGFKTVNDTAGHHAGDAVLREVAARLARATRAQDLVCRLGGDEFTVVLTDVTTDEVIRIRERIVATVGEPVTVDGGSYRVGASVGAAVATAGTLVPDDLLHDADRAMYRVKGERKARV